MDDFSEPTNDLEHAIAAMGDAPEADPKAEARRAVLVALALNQVTVLTKEPWDGETPTGTSAMDLMYVSDGKNLEQPMLALFTNTERAVHFEQTNDAFHNPCTVAGPWALGNVVEGAGIMINPNQNLGFRIVPELAKILQRDVATAIERARERERADNMGS
ncbi:MAG: SseB family protein [Gammaproteobacteria bacterium]